MYSCTYNKSKKKGREEREGTDERGKEGWEWMTELGGRKGTDERGKEGRKGKEREKMREGGA